MFLQCTSPFIDPADLDAAVLVLDGKADVVFSAESHEFVDPGRRRPGGSGPQRPPSAPPPGPGPPLPGDRRVLRDAHRGAAAAGTGSSGGPRGARSPRARRRDRQAEDLAVARALAPLADRPDPLDVASWSPTSTGCTPTTGPGCTRTAPSRSGSRGGTAWASPCSGRAGVPVLILSTETNPVVAARARKLGVPSCRARRQGVGAGRVARGRGTRPAAPPTSATTSTTSDASPVGWPIAVPHAHPDVLAAARLVLSRPGGGGAVREVCDLVLAARSPAAHRLSGPRVLHRSRIRRRPRQHPGGHQQPHGSPPSTATAPVPRAAGAAGPQLGGRDQVGHSARPGRPRQRGGSSSRPSRPDQG